MKQKLEQLAKLNEQAQIEGEKFVSGNKSAGTRLRKITMEIKNLCGEIRKEVSEIKNQA